MRTGNDLKTPASGGHRRPAVQGRMGARISAAVGALQLACSLCAPLIRENSAALLRATFVPELCQRAKAATSTRYVRALFRPINICCIGDISARPGPEPDFEFHSLCQNIKLRPAKILRIEADEQSTRHFEFFTPLISHPGPPGETRHEPALFSTWISEFCMSTTSPTSNIQT